MLLIVYGSLYPWHFVPQHLPHNPVWMLLHTWNAPVNRFMMRDIVVNVALYVPLGMAAFLVLRRVTATLLLGLCLSVAMEIAQAFDPARRTSGLDVLTNVLGTAAGVGAGILFRRIAGRKLRHHLRYRFKVVDQGALILLFLAAGYLMFPFFPLTGLYLPHQKLGVFLHAPLLAPEPFLTAAAVWLAAGKMLRAAGFHRARVWLACSILLIPLQFFLVDRQPMPAQIPGAVCGVLLFIGLRGAWWPAGILFVDLIVRGLAPFQFSPEGSAFSFIPFGGFLGAEWQSATYTLIEKTFFYGSAIWLLKRARLRYRTATALVAGILLAIEILQIHLPGRTPEISDPLLALLAGFGLAGLARDPATVTADT